MAGTKGVVVPSLKHYRLRSALGQRELAEKAHISRATVIRGEHGGTIRYSAVRQLAQALNVTPEQLTSKAPDDEEERGAA